MSAQWSPRAEAGALRPMVRGDIGAVMAVEARAYSHPWTHGNFADSLAAGYVAELLPAGASQPGHGPGAAGVVAVVGYFVAMAGVDELHLLNITVAPEWQGRGHGSTMLDAVHAHAAARDLGAVWLEVRESNRRAQALYRRRGYVDVGMRRGYYPAAARREDAVVMRLQVRGEAA